MSVKWNLDFIIFATSNALNKKQLWWLRIKGSFNMRTCLILKVVELFYNKDNFSSIISVLKRSLGLEAHCSGFCYFFLHKTSPWSFHSVTIDERSFITTFLLLMLKNIIQDDESQSKVSCKKHLKDFPHFDMTSICVFFVIW